MIASLQMEVFVQKNCTLAAVAEVWGLESGFLVAQTHAWRTIDQNSGMAPDLKQVDADLIVNLVYLAGIFTCFRVSTGYESEVQYCFMLDVDRTWKKFCRK
jgi:hypothetical protein